MHVPPSSPFCSFCSLFSSLSHFHIFKKSLPKTSYHISASPGAPGWLTCLPTLSHLQTIHSQLSPHNKNTHRSFLLVSRSKLLTTSLLFGSGTLQNKSFESPPYPHVRVCRNNIKKTQTDICILTARHSTSRRCGYDAPDVVCELMSVEVDVIPEHCRQRGKHKGGEICAYFCRLARSFGAQFKAQACANGDSRQQQEKEEEAEEVEEVEKARDLTTPGTLIFILVPPQANSAGYRNNLRVSFFFPPHWHCAQCPRNRRYPGPLVTSHMQTKGPETVSRRRDEDRMSEQTESLRFCLEGKKLGAFLASFFFFFQNH